MSQIERMIEIPCNICQHKDVCKHMDTMNKAKDIIAEKFYGSPFGSENRFALIDSMNISGIGILLTCKHQMKEEVLF